MMSKFIFVLCAISTVFFVNVFGTPLLGAKECTWGPSYWCTNITAATHCGAVKHCIQTVWEKQTVPHDDDSVCQICTKMVAEARDQLESNETQEELKEVFEGSCKLIPLKIISKECCKLADDFIPQLVETLASQMNPQVVCSVAGLCNNARIDQLLAEDAAKKMVASSMHKSAKSAAQNECNNCYTVMNKVESNFAGLTQDQMLEGMLTLCGRMDSLSDGCANIAITYFNELYNHLKNDLNAESVCHVSGVCSQMYHQHPEIQVESIEIIPHGVTGVQPVSDDDLPCKLCTQLVGHLRDLLVANTTEGEFQKVLEGICKQTKTFKAECLNIADEYYPMIYEFLVKQLDGKEVCIMAGICPGPGLLSGDAPIWPLLPANIANKAEKLMSKPPKVETNDKSIEPMLSSLEIQNAQLPIDRILPSSILGVQNTQACSLCEYILHYIQVEISDSTVEEKIKHAVENICDKLPSSVKGECRGFIETYGDAFIALLAQEMDPSQVCPMLSLCPKQDVKDVEVLIHDTHVEKPNCPLCLFAVKQLEDMLQNKKTVSDIEQALDTLCTHLPKDLVAECNDFVESYSKELIEMLIADLDPQEVCVYLHICNPKNPKPNMDHVSTLIDVETHYHGAGEILTNEIPDDTIGGQPLVTAHLAFPKDNTQCVLCEFVMTQIENSLKDRKNEEEIVHVVHNVCNALPKDIGRECNEFVNEYAEMVIKLLIQLAEPKDICTMMHLCKKQASSYSQSAVKIQSDVTGPLCLTCKLIMNEIVTQLNGSVDSNDIKNVVHQVCNVFSGQTYADCNSFLHSYADVVIDYLAKHMTPADICSAIALCGQEIEKIQSSIMECTICEETVGALHLLIQNPNVDHEIEHMLKKACSALPTREFDKCKKIVSVYGRSMINLLLRMTDTQTVCKKIGLCGPGKVSAGKDRVLESKKMPLYVEKEPVLSDRN